MIWMLLACAPDPCEGDSANLTCSVATQSVDYYAELSSRYFDTMDSRVDLEEEMPYSEQVVRWEWTSHWHNASSQRKPMCAM